MKVLKLIFFCLIISSSTSNILAQEKVNAKHDSTIDKLIPKAQKKQTQRKANKTACRLISPSQSKQPQKNNRT